MILIDALYVNTGGGKVLLDYLIENLEKNNLKIFYLLDERVKNSIPAISTHNEVIFMKASLLQRQRFYKKNKTNYTKVFCFGNLPPNIKLSAITYTYFHQTLYLFTPERFHLLNRAFLMMKITILKRIKKNTDFWMVQSNLIKQKFIEKYKVKNEKVLLMPFYPPLQSLSLNLNIDRKKDQYIYVSTAPQHKNHQKLIEAFSEFYDQNKKGKLILTVSEKFPEILKIIEHKQNCGYPIINLGFVPRQNLSKVYQESEYLIYPSLAESFGLGLVEAIENGCKVIGADLPYTYEVCEPSIIFDPLDERSILKALTLSLQNNIKPSVAKISNKIDELISLLK